LYTVTSKVLTMLTEQMKSWTLHNQNAVFLVRDFCPGRYNSLLSGPLYIGHIWLSLVWPLWRGSTVFLKKKWRWQHMWIILFFRIWFQLLRILRNKTLAVYQNMWNILLNSSWVSNMLFFSFCLVQWKNKYRQML